MKILPFIPLCLVLALLAAPSPAGAAVTETMAITYYPVAVQPSETPATAVFRSTPIQEDGKPYAGHTQTALHWHSRWKPQADRLCWISEVTVSIDITMILPQLVSPTPFQKMQFDAYLVRLKTHEDGHADIGRDTARRIDAAIAGIHAPCSAVNTLINDTAQGLIEQMNAENTEYDLLTQHGKTQGASLNDIPWQ